ncbi:MAG TPA: hypothetical protein VM186_00320, partial [Planctomycetota bacterium]|nr:hypothetical protein [Planctomycetota bacterium]
MVWQRSTFWQIEGSGDRQDASKSDISMIVGPNHYIYCDGPWRFGLAADGTVSPGTDAPAFAQFSGNTITLSSVKVDVNIDWPDDCVGYYEMTGSGGRATIDQTISLDDDMEYIVQGAGWDYDTLHIELQAGVLSISLNTQNVGVTADDATKTVTFTGVSVTIDSLRTTFWEVEGTGRVTGSMTFVVAVAPNHPVYEESIGWLPPDNRPSFRFGVDAAGTITPNADAPWWVMVEGSVMTFDTDAVDVSFFWPAGLRGWWECTGSGGRVYNDGKIIPFVTGEYNIGGGDWHDDTLHISLMDGVAWISKNLDNVGLVDNEDNTFTWQDAEIAVISERASYWECNQTERVTGNKTWLTIPSDWHSIYVDPGTTFHFAVDTDGIIALDVDAPEWATADGNTITLASSAVDVTFNWPDGAGGFYEFSGSGGRQSATKTFPMDDGAHIIAGEGWDYGTLEITITEGVADITKNTQNVNLVKDEGVDNSFSFLAGTLTVQTERVAFWECYGTGRTVGNRTITMVAAPNLGMGGAGLSYHFGLAPDGTITLADDAPSFVTAEGSVMTIATQAYACNPGGFAGQWQIAVLSGVGDVQAWIPDPAPSGELEINLNPGAYAMYINCVAGQWMGFNHAFLINDDWSVSDGVWTYTDTATSTEYTFTIGPAVPPLCVTAFTVADQSTGSAVFTNSATVDVSITTDPPEANIVGWQITETDLPPDTWLTEAPATYTIAGGEGTVTLYAWVIDDTDAIAGGTAEILFSTAVPQVLSRTVADNVDGTATATWTTDIPAEGGMKFGPVSMAGTTPNVTPLEGATGTDHSVTFAIAAGVNYKVVLVNNETDSPAFFWPSPWAIPGDADMDCRVNI